MAYVKSVTASSSLPCCSWVHYSRPSSAVSVAAASSQDGRGQVLDPLLLRMARGEGFFFLLFFFLFRPPRSLLTEHNIVWFESLRVGAFQ